MQHMSQRSCRRTWRLTLVGGIRALEALLDAERSPAAPVRIEARLLVLRGLEGREDRAPFRLVGLGLDLRLHPQEPKGRVPDGRYERRDDPPPHPRPRPVLLRP